MISYVLEHLAVFIVGLLVGWNVLPQPTWVKDKWDQIAAKFRKGEE